MQALPEALIISEDERPVAPYWPAQCTAKLISPEGRVNGLREKVAGIQLVVAQKLEKVAVQLVRTGHRYHADLSAGTLAVLGAICVLEHVELADRVNAQEQAAHASRHHVGCGDAGVLDAVHQ